MQLALKPITDKGFQLLFPFECGSRLNVFLIFYCATSSSVEVLRMLHGARNLEAILDEDVDE